MGRKVKYTKAFLAEIVETYRRYLGNLTQTCKLLKIPPKMIYEYMEKSPDFKEEMLAIRESESIDFVESKLMQKINEGDTTSIIFFLKTRGKKRGYSERFELTGANGKDLIDERTDDEIKAEIEKMQKECEE